MAEVMPSISPEGKERQVHAGFAKLRGRGWEFFMQKYEIVLGRHSKNSAVDIDLAKDGGGMNVSRRHARIYYNFERKRFEMEVLGKNGASVDGQLKVPSDGPVPLESQMLVVIGDFPFYFLLPTKKIEKRRPSEPNGVCGRAAHNGGDASDGVNGAYEMESNGPEAEDEAQLPDYETGERIQVGKREPEAEESGYKITRTLEKTRIEEAYGPEGHPAKQKKGRVKKVKEEESVEDGGELVEDTWQPGGDERGLGPSEERTVKGEQELSEQEEKVTGLNVHGSAHIFGSGPIHRNKKREQSKIGERVRHSEDSIAGRRRKRESEGGVDEPGPSTSQRKAARKKAPAEDGSNRDGSPEPVFQGRNLRVASPPRRKWPGDADTKPTKVAPVSPTRAGLRRAAAEAAAGAERRGGMTGGGGTAGGGETEAAELADAVAGILGGQDDRTAAVPLNRLFMLLSERHRELYDRSRELLTDAAEGDASEQLHRPWLALASFLKRYPQRFVVESQAKGRLVSWYAALRQA